MAVFKWTFPLILLWTLMAKSQNLIKDTNKQKLEDRLMIYEVNSDNPGYDHYEFLELYHTSGQNVSLDGYTLVFYNGRTNTAYKVIHLKGRYTDKKGFFLIGSVGIRPAPDIILPINTIQNGPDAIAIYNGKGPYKENMRVTNEGLVDALVHKSKSTDQADVLQAVLTPGVDAFLENSTFHILDESIGRCLGIDGIWIFQMTHLSPGSENFCQGFPDVVINEISSPFSKDFYIEFKGPPLMMLSGLILVFIRGDDQEVYYFMDIKGQTNSNGIYLLEKENPDNHANQTLPDSALLPTKSGGAVAVYLENRSKIDLKSRFPTSGLVDAIVYGDNESMVYLQDLTMGRPIIDWHGGNLSSSVSRCSGGAGNPVLFLFTNSTPGAPNDCPSESGIRQVTMCFRILDCSHWQGEPLLSKVLTVLVKSLQDLCRCNVPANFLTDVTLSCQSNILTLHAKQNDPSPLQKDDSADAQQKFVSSGKTINVDGRKATVMPTCQQNTDSSTLPPDNAVVASSTASASGTHILLINELNPNTPGSGEDTEYVELYYTGNGSTSLDGYWLVFYNGKNNLAYFTLDLKGHSTDQNGRFLVGSPGLTPKPHIVIPVNTIQNGVDAVALYFRPGKGYKKNSELTSDGLVDALVYVSQMDDNAKGLLKVLAPGQEAVHEDQNFLLEDESLSRCHGLIPFEHSSYQVTKITPLADNDCLTAVPSVPSSVNPKQPVTPSRPLSLIINEMVLSSESEPYNFIELQGPPGSRLDGYTLVMYGYDGKVYARMDLQGTVGVNGYFLISPNEPYDQRLPMFYSTSSHGPEALALYKGSRENFPLGSNVNRKEDLIDAVVYTWNSETETKVLKELERDSIILNKEQIPVSLSRCPQSTLPLLPVMNPSPGSANLCPSSVTSIHVCLKDPSSNCSKWDQNILNSMKASISESIEEHCSCFLPPSYIQALELTCTEMGQSISANVVSFHEDLHHIETWHRDVLSHPVSPKDTFLGSIINCSDTAQRFLSTWKVVLLVLLILLLICGAMGFIVYLRKRRPQNYTTIEMNQHQELTMDF
ncbi:uncharacterized protein LOC128642006 [Bombina bombina]|uniref:uncharacterized protein LOC128642006 n=1 Tax=Bombina bombina TaxID=8345 RepID=UPI00235B1608|nr:uncharacterized protein LOC128642006 [Bombina bombina]